MTTAFIWWVGAVHLAAYLVATTVAVGHYLLVKPRLTLKERIVEGLRERRRRD